MEAEQPDIGLPRAAKVELVGGGQLVGRLYAFSPGDEWLTLESDCNSDGGQTSRRVASSSVAYVAYQNQGTPPHRREDHTNVPMRIHLAQGRTILVDPLSDPKDPLGFRALPLDGEGDIEEIFFFSRSINRIERDEPIGSMLLQASAVDEKELERGLGRQASLPRKRIGDILLARNKIDPEALGQALDAQRRKSTRIGEVLIEMGLATCEEVEAALTEQRRSGRKRIGSILVEMGVVEEGVLAQTLAEKFHLPFVDLDACLISPEAGRSIPRWILERHRVLPIDVDEKCITLALSDPLNTEAIDLVRFQHREEIREVVATPSQIERYLTHLLSNEDVGTEQTRLEELLSAADLEASVPAPEEEWDDSDGFEVGESDSAVIQLANQVIVEAVRRDASDIHIEPQPGGKGVGIRIRIDGDCVALPMVPASYGRALVSRIKIMAKLDIAEQRKPQDGKLLIRLPERRVELRVATIPTVGGEDIVLRVLAGSEPMSLGKMGLSDWNRRALERMVQCKHGLVLSVGPTGSGKTTSLHSLLGHINVPERKIWTAEDPVEITQPGLRQVEVRPKIGFGFAEALRAFLRADPDVVMIGEMRDTETAEIAIHASLTGHLVLSTLHTNSAPETVVRLAQMGCDPFSFGDALLGILAQRLARRLCEACRSLEPANESDRAVLRDALGDDDASEKVGDLLWRARGCDACRGSGYRGRIAIHELLAVNEPLRAAIHEGASADRIREIAVEAGMKTMFQDGVQKCLSGETDLQQLLAISSSGRSLESTA